MIADQYRRALQALAQQLEDQGIDPATDRFFRSDYRRFVPGPFPADWRAVLGLNPPPSSGGDASYSLEPPVASFERQPPPGPLSLSRTDVLDALFGPVPDGSALTESEYRRAHHLDVCDLDPAARERELARIGWRLMLDDDPGTQEWLRGQHDALLATRPTDAREVRHG